jgi:hypothetical protein
MVYVIQVCRQLLSSRIRIEHYLRCQPVCHIYIIMTTYIYIYKYLTKILYAFVLGCMYSIGPALSELRTYFLTYFDDGAESL